MTFDDSRTAGVVGTTSPRFGVGALVHFALVDHGHLSLATGIVQQSPRRNLFDGWLYQLRDEAGLRFEQLESELLAAGGAR